MDTKEVALDKYTAKAKEIKSYVESHKDVFEKHQKMLFELMDIENELKDIVALDKSGISNSEFEVVYTPNKQRVYNEDKMHEYLTPTQFANVVNDVDRSPRISIRPKFK